MIRLYYIIFRLDYIYIIFTLCYIIFFYIMLYYFIYQKLALTEKQTTNKIKTQWEKS